MKIKCFVISLCLLMLFGVAGGLFAEKKPSAEKQPTAAELPPTAKWIPEDELWKWTQFEGEVINIEVQSTPPCWAISKLLNEFEQFTGIKVNWTELTLEEIATRIILDFTTASGKIDVFSCDPYQTVAPLHAHLMDLNTFSEDSSLPMLNPKDFSEADWIGNAYYADETRVLAVPLNICNMILIYRKDVFTNPKYKDLFMKEMGYDWTPTDITWQNYYEIAKWINEKVEEGVITEVEFATGHHAKQADPLQCDFSNVLAAFGGDYFKKSPRASKWGTDLPGDCTLDEPEAIKAAEFYKKLIEVSAPGVANWDWVDLYDALSAGKIAMAPSWSEYAPDLENPEGSKVVGKLGYTLLPKGPTGRSANMWGGYGLAVNKYSPEAEKKAAWLFLVWATGPGVQELGIPLGYFPPTRYSVYETDTVKNMDPSLKEAMLASLEAAKEQNAYWRPKVPQWLECLVVIGSRVSKMITGQETPESAMQDAATQIDKITGWEKFKK